MPPPTIADNVPVVTASGAQSSFMLGKNQVLVVKAFGGSGGTGAYFSDPGDVMALSAPQLPASTAGRLVLDAATGVVRLLPAYKKAGSVAFSLMATDAANQTSDLVDFTAIVGARRAHAYPGA